LNHSALLDSIFHSGDSL